MKIVTDNVMHDFMVKVDMIDNPKEGDLHVSPSLIMKTCAYYVGSMCAEFLDGEWLYQPYDRYTEYMSYEDAANWYAESKL